MSKPVIVCVDDEPEVLGAVERDLRQHYRGEYRIVRAGSGAEGLEVARQLKERGHDIALFLSDERMPEMSGTQMLHEAQRLYPDSRKVLLTAYADTEAAIRGINEVGLDHYLMKPWDPPDMKLYPVLDDQLASWAATARTPYEGIRVVGATWAPQCYDVKEFLSRNGVPYQWLDVEADPTAKELALHITGDAAVLPVVLFPDGNSLVRPTNGELAGRLGMSLQASKRFYDLVIVGAGPAGLAASVYGASEGLGTLLIEQNAPGGQAGTSSRIENYLGFPTGVTGADLSMRAVAQAKKFGVEILSAQSVESIRREDPYRVITLANGEEISTYALILAQGVAIRKLDAPGIDGLTGRGVYYGAAMTEAATYRDRPVCVVGGANSAGQGALFFSRYASQVTVLTRSPLEKSMSKYLIDRIEAAPNMDTLTGYVVDSVHGENELTGITVRETDGTRTRELVAAAMFIFIGAAPHTSMADGLLAMDEKGFLLTGPDLPAGPAGKPAGWTLDRDPYLYETNVPGIFAVGDVRAGSGKRVAAAVGEGSGCVGQVHRYLATV